MIEALYNPGSAVVNEPHHALEDNARRSCTPKDPVARMHHFARDRLLRSLNVRGEVYPGLSPYCDAVAIVVMGINPAGPQ